jgi:hypothetical protein
MVLGAGSRPVGWIGLISASLFGLGYEAFVTFLSYFYYELFYPLAFGLATAATGLGFPGALTAGVGPAANV